MFLPFVISKRIIASFLLFYFFMNLLTLLQWGIRDPDQKHHSNEGLKEETKHQGQRLRPRRSLGKRYEFKMLKTKKSSSSFSASNLTKIQEHGNISSIRAGFKYPAYPRPWTIINMTVSYLMNNYNICGDPRRDPVFMLIIIHSHAGNKNFRNAFRAGLLKYEMEEAGLRRLFVLADPNSEMSQTQKYDARYDSTSLEELLEENSVHSDMIIGDFHDTYRNLSYKHIMGLEWAQRYCAQAKYILKQDDDTFVDYYQIMTLLRLAEKPRQSLNISIEEEKVMHRVWTELENSTLQTKQKFQMMVQLSMVIQHGGDPRFIIGNVNSQVKPRRDENQDWYVTRKEWPRRLYPDYVPGFAYITNIPTIKDLVWKSKQAVYFWIDDIFVTGVLRIRAKIPLKDVKYILSMSAHRELDLCSRPVNIPSAPRDTYSEVMKILMEQLSPNSIKSEEKLAQELLPKSWRKSSPTTPSSTTPAPIKPAQFGGKWCILLAGVRARKKLLQFMIPFMNHARFCYKTNLCTFIQD